MTNPRVEILKDCRFYLEKLQMCNKIRPRFWILPIPNIMLNFVFMIPMFTTSFCLMRYVISTGFNLNTVSSSFAITMGCTQLAFIYVGLAINRRIVYETMDQMQHLVDYRRF